MKVVIDEHTKGEVYLSARDIEECEIQTSPVIELYLSGNLLTSFIVGDGAFPNLKRLYLSSNRLTSFVFGDGAFPNLEHLYLSGNRLTSFFGDGAFPNLKALALSNNRLTSFVVGDGAFPNLEYLNVSYNPIQVLDLYRSQVPKLNRTRLENTGIEFVDPSVIETVRGKKVEPRAHILETVCLVEEAFFPKGHPIAEEIIEGIQV